MDQAITMAFGDDQLRAGAEQREQEAAFAALVCRHTRFVFRVAYALLRNASDAEDVAQETFLKVHRGNLWSAMRDERAFLAKMTWRLALDRKRSQATGARLRVIVEQFDGLRGAGRDPEQLAATGDATARVHALIDDLPEELRQPLVLSAIEGLNSREIAELLGIKEGTVRTRMMRARQNLKDKLASQTGVRNA